MRHGFFMRAGGVSKVPFDSLNFSASVGDDPLSVRRNRELGARALGVSADRVFRVSQVHGSDVVVVSEEGAAETAKKPGDAVISATPGTACGVITADCVPILLASRTSGHVAAVHSGWKGFVAGVLPRTIGELRETGAGEPWLRSGPHISSMPSRFRRRGRAARRLGLQGSTSFARAIHALTWTCAGLRGPSSFRVGPSSGRWWTMDGVHVPRAEPLLLPSQRWRGVDANSQPSSRGKRRRAAGKRPAKDRGRARAEGRQRSSKHHRLRPSVDDETMADVKSLCLALAFLLGVLGCSSGDPQDGTGGTDGGGGEATGPAGSASGGASSGGTFWRRRVRWQCIRW